VNLVALGRENDRQPEIATIKKSSYVEDRLAIPLDDRE
jgi:hypothetical protein